MTVTAFKTLEEASMSLWSYNPDEVYYRGLAEFYSFACRIHPPRHPKGLFKFASFEEAGLALRTFLSSSS